MPIDPKQAVGQSLGTTNASYEARDVILYHLGLGAGSPATDARELKYTYESDLKVLPSFAVVAGQMNTLSAKNKRGLNDIPGLSFDLANLLHGEQEIILHRPLPTKARISTETHIGEIYDKGKAAVVVMQGSTLDESDAPLYSTRSSLFIRGEGGFGGETGPNVRNATPDRKPDGVVLWPTLPQQALLYRLTGDMNPLHADPIFAKKAGFEAPIIHGLCSYGIVCKAIVDEVLSGDVTRVGRYAARFAGVFFPGETYEISYWNEGDKIFAEAACRERAAPVISNAVVELKE